MQLRPLDEKSGNYFDDTFMSLAILRSRPTNKKTIHPLIDMKTLVLNSALLQGSFPSEPRLFKPT
jgi:hypothetical protein